MSEEICRSGDVEIVELACRSLRSVCGSDYQLELCHIGYFNALVDSLDTDPATREQIRELVEHKNFPALDLLLERFEGCPAQKALKKLPALFGSVSVLEEARALFSNEAADRALDALADLYNALSSLGLDHLSLDLGLVNQADYYTGIIFRGYTAGAGRAVLAGGRYDELIGEFGPARPATGFGINLDLLCERAEGTAAVPPPPRGGAGGRQKSGDRGVFAGRTALQPAVCGGAGPGRRYPGRACPRGL